MKNAAIIATAILALLAVAHQVSQSQPENFLQAGSASVKKSSGGSKKNMNLMSEHSQITMAGAKVKFSKKSEVNFLEDAEIDYEEDNAKLLKAGTTIYCSTYGASKCMSIYNSGYYYRVNTVNTYLSDNTYTHLCQDFSSNSNAYATASNKWFFGYNLSGTYAYSYSGTWNFDGSAQLDQCIYSVTCSNGQQYACY
jgi:hypothetical protein